MGRRVLLLGILLAVLPAVIAEEPIRYDHTMVAREIRKQFGTDTYTLYEIMDTDSLDTNPMGKGKYFRVSADMSLLGYLYIGRVNSCRSGGCSVPLNDSSALAFEYFDYLILTDQKGEVNSVRIFNYQATHGHEICSKGWLRQFSGYSGSEDLTVGKNIDAISGATISTHSITYDVQLVIRTLVSSQMGTGKLISRSKPD